MRQNMETEISLSILTTRYSLKKKNCTIYCYVNVFCKNVFVVFLYLKHKSEINYNYYSLIIIIFVVLVVVFVVVVKNYD